MDSIHFHMDFMQFQVDSIHFHVDSIYFSMDSIQLVSHRIIFIQISKFTSKEIPKLVILYKRKLPERVTVQKN